MVTPEEIVRCLLTTFDKRALTLFRSWLAQHPSITKWIIASDFALRDPNRPADCFAFTLIPYDALPQDIEADITANLPKDIKKSKTINDATIAWLRDPRRFHFAILMERNRAYYSTGPGSDQLNIARKSLQRTLETIVRAERDADQIRRLRKLVNKSQAKRFNVDLLTDLTFLAIWFPLITLLLVREHRSNIVGWFSDRDKMTTWCDGIVWDFAREHLYDLGQVLGIDITDLLTPIATPEKTPNGEDMWFDDYIRPADWLAGALAAWNRVHNLVPGEQDKYVLTLREVVADSPNIVLLPVYTDGSGIRCTRLMVSQTPITEPSI